MKRSLICLIYDCCDVFLRFQSELWLVSTNRLDVSCKWLYKSCWFSLEAPLAIWLSLATPLVFVGISWIADIWFYGLLGRMWCRFWGCTAMGVDSICWLCWNVGIVCVDDSWWGRRGKCVRHPWIVFQISDDWIRYKLKFKMLKNRNILSSTRLSKKNIKTHSEVPSHPKISRMSLQINNIITSLEKNVKELKTYYRDR